MKKSNKIFSAIVLAIMICTISVLSYATTNEYNVKMKSNKTKYNAGETVEIVVSVEDIKTDEGIAAFSAILNYDESIFKNIKVEEIDEWDQPMLVENMIQATRKDMLNSKENQRVAVISLEIEEDIQSTNTIIKLSKFDVTDGNTTMRNDEGAFIKLDIFSKESIKDNIAQNNYMIYIIIAICIIATVVVILVIKNKKNKKKNKK